MKPHPSPATLGPMTDLASVPGGAPPATGHRTGGVSVRELHSMGELERVDRLLLSIWSSEDQQPPVSAHMLRALSHSGAYVAGAFDDDGDLVGACVGFFGPPQDRSLHSHIAGVAPRAQGRNVGFLLKSHQHGWARALGVREVTWTFDPLVRRNAYFNLAKLGALPTAYLPDFYGEMVDGINAGQGSDRLYLAWDTTAPVSPRLVTDVEGATAVLTVSTRPAARGHRRRERRQAARRCPRGHRRAARPSTLSSVGAGGQPCARCSAVCSPTAPR